MDKAQTIKWLSASVIRGVAWALAAWFGMSATASNETSTMITDSVIGLVLAGVSIYTSIKGRKKLLSTPPPKG